MSTKVTQQVMDFVKSIAKNDGGRNEKHIDHKKGYMELCNLLSGNMLNLTEDDAEYLMGLKLEYENRYFPDYECEVQDNKNVTDEKPEIKEEASLEKAEIKESTQDEPKKETIKDAPENKEEVKTEDKTADKKPIVKTKGNKKRKRTNPFDKRPRFQPRTKKQPSTKPKTVVNRHIDNSRNNNYNYGSGNINVGGNMIISE